MIPGLLQEIYREVSVHFGKGRVASYIPALRKVAPHSFGMTVNSVDGNQYSVRDAMVPFSIQSIAKLFCLCLTLRLHGNDIWTRVGKEPSGTRFNSLVLLEHERGVPRNPFINAGALVVVDSLFGAGRPTPPLLVRDFARVLSQDFELDFDEQVYRSEIRSAHQNAAIAHLLKAHKRIRHDPDEVLQAYCRICALRMSCESLARAFLPLAASGLSPILQEQVLTKDQARRINALMMTSGMYDSVGSFAYRVGLPAKSGVGGGIVAVVPRKCVIAVWSPELDRGGNSLVGTAALESFVRHTGVSIL
ncbi:MAG: glutaminase [Dehalococcoidia bacterium]